MTRNDHLADSCSIIQPCLTVPTDMQLGSNRHEIFRGFEKLQHFVTDTTLTCTVHLLSDLEPFLLYSLLAQPHDH